MVRPVARFRPAARRSGGDLVPVFFTRPSGTPGPLTIRSGSQPGGIVKELNIYDDAPRTLAPITSKGLLEEHLKPDIQLVNADTVVYAESETFESSSSFGIARMDAIDGFAYVLCLRSHIVTHRASITYQYFDFQGLNGQEYGPISPVITASAGGALDAVFDAVVFSIDLETGAMSENHKVVYRYDATITGFFPQSGRIIAKQAYEWFYPPQLAFSELLPESHPFKVCGSSVWGEAATSPTESITYPYDENGVRVLSNPVAFSYFYSQMSKDFSALVGLNTQAQKRMIQNGAVFELSDYISSTASPCDLYQGIGALWVDSFSDFAPEQLSDREDVFTDLSGLSQGDQAVFLQSSLQPPSSLQPGVINPGTTVNPVFFLAGSSAGSLSFAQNQQLTIRYWIPD